MRPLTAKAAKQLVFNSILENIEVSAKDGHYNFYLKIDKHFNATPLARRLDSLGYQVQVIVENSSFFKKSDVVYLKITWSD